MKGSTFLLTATVIFAIVSILFILTPTHLNYLVVAQSQNQSEDKVHTYANLTNEGVIRPLQPSTGASGNASFTLVGDGNTMS